MTVRKEGLDYNILGSHVRITPEQDKDGIASRAVEILKNEIESLKASNSKLSNIDLAVLASLRIASRNLELEGEYKENMFSLRSGINDALDFIHDVSPGQMQEQ